MIDGMMDGFCTVPGIGIWSILSRSWVDEDDARLLAWQDTGGVMHEIGSVEALCTMLDHIGLGATAPWPLENLKARLCAAIDAEAGRLRCFHITDIPGQEMVYQRKAGEARAMASDPNPQPANYPLLTSLVGVEAPDLASEGALVRARDALWTGIGAAIEAARVGAKRNVMAAATAEEALAARAAAAWPSL